MERFHLRATSVHSLLSKLSIAGTPSEETSLTVSTFVKFYLYKRILVSYKGVFNGSNSSPSDCILSSKKRHPLLLIIFDISIVVTIVVGVFKIDWPPRSYPSSLIHIWK